MTSEATVGFVIPDPGGTPSGGHTYNDRVLRRWAERGHAAEAVTVGGGWPHPDDAARERLAEALRRHTVSLVDGLVGACCPQQIQEATATGHRVVLLIHLPLADETGLTLGAARDLEGLERWAAHAATAVVATSKTAAEDVRHRHDLGDVGAVPPGADPRPVSSGGVDVATGTRRLGVVASVTPRKNQSGLVEALALLADRAWSADFVGPQPDPTYAAAVRDRAAALGLADRIALPGVLDDADLERFWSRLDLLLLPSLHETYGLVVTEALAHGIPAVVSRGTGAVEALTGTPCVGADSTAAPSDVVDRADTGPVGPAGALIDPRSREDMARVIGGWLDDATTRTAWRERALARRAGLRPWSAAAAELWAFVQAAGSGPAA